MSVLVVRSYRPYGYGERLLLASILRRAAYDIALYRGSTNLKSRRIWEDAHRWMFDDQAEHFTSFNSICSLLDQDPRRIREKTLRLTKKDVRKYDMVDSHGRV